MAVEPLDALGAGQGSFRVGLHCPAGRGVGRDVVVPVIFERVPRYACPMPPQTNDERWEAVKELYRLVRNSEDKGKCFGNGQIPAMRRVGQLRGVK